MQPSTLGLLFAAIMCAAAVPSVKGRDDIAPYCLGQVDRLESTGATLLVYLDRNVCGCRFEVEFENFATTGVPPRYYADLLATQQWEGTCHDMYSVDLSGESGKRWHYGNRIEIFFRNVWTVVELDVPKA